MIKENIEVLDSLRPEEVRFNFNPLNRNLCFSGGSYTGGEGNIVDEFKGMFNSMTSPFGGGSGGGDMDTEGGLSAEDKAFKTYLYSKLKPLMEQEYESYEGDRFADRSPEELALLKQAQEGHPMFDQASKDLGFTQQAYKDAAGYDIDQLDKDTADLMAGDSYREVERSILEAMNRGASMSGMDITGSAWGSGAGGTHSRGGTSGTARLQSNLGYHKQAGDALSKLHYDALRDARGTARGLRDDRLRAAQGYGSTALANLGIGKDKYASQFGAFKDERGDRQRDLDWNYKQWLDEKNDPYKKFSWGTGNWGTMPFEEKVVTSQPASGGK